MGEWVNLRVREQKGPPKPEWVGTIKNLGSGGFSFKIFPAHRQPACPCFSLYYCTAHPTYVGLFDHTFPSAADNMASFSPPHQRPRGPENELHMAAFQGSTERFGVAQVSDGSIDIDEGSEFGTCTPLMVASCMMSFGCCEDPPQQGCQRFNSSW